MRISGALETSDSTMQASAARHGSDVVLPWPVAAAVIAALSIGLWVLIVWIGRALFG